MARKNGKKESGEATRASVRKVMAKPRMAKSARIAELNLDASRISEEASITLSGTVDKIVWSPRPSKPEKAHIALDGADRIYQEIRIENVITDENGDDVKLKKGAHVEVTVAGKGVKPVR
jgi:hypothetical protein